MQSSGGVAPAAEAARAGAWSVLSGPAGGAVGAGLLARAQRRRQRARLRHGRDLLRRLRGRGRARSGAPTRARSTAARSSCRWSTSTRSAPAAARSAGATPAARCGSARARPAPSPGPACYGRGGTEPTVTDANLLLGYLAADSTPGRRRRARRRGGRAAAVGRAGRASSASSELETAEGIVRVANQEMVRALRVVTVERGVDPRRFALLPFGGAGPMHAAAIAAELGIEPHPLPARRRRPLGARALRLRPPPRHRPHRDARAATTSTAERIAAEVDELASRARRRPRGRRARGRLRDALRRPGLRAAGPGRRPSPTRPSWPSDFAARARGALRPPRPRGRGRAGRHPPGAGRRRAPSRGPRRPRRDGSSESARAVRFDGEWVETPVLRGEPRGRDCSAEGPCVFELPEATLVAAARLDAPRSTTPARSSRASGEAE